MAPPDPHRLQTANHSQPFALPRPPIGCQPAPFSTEQRFGPHCWDDVPNSGAAIHLSLSFCYSSSSRFQRQLSEPCLSFLPPDKALAASSYQPPPSHERRPLYQRHLSEPLVLPGPRDLKQEVVDPRYPEPRLPPAPGLSRPQNTFNQVTIKQEPRDFSFDSGLMVVSAVFFLSLIRQRIISPHDYLLPRCLCRGSHMPVVTFWPITSLVFKQCR